MGGSNFTREKVQWLHDAATEFASTEMKMTMDPDEVLALTGALLAAMDSEPIYQYWCYTHIENSDGDQEEFWFWKDCDKRFYDLFVGEKRMLYLHAQSAVDRESDCKERKLFCSTDTARMRKVISASAGTEAIPLYRHAQPATASEPLAVTDDELNAALQLHRLKVDGHSQLSDAFRAGFRYARRTTPQTAPVVPDDCQHLRKLYHAQEKRLFKIAQRIKGPAFDKYAYSPSQAIDVLETAIFGEDAMAKDLVEHLKAGTTETIVLSEESWNHLQEIIASPPEPSARLRELITRNPRYVTKPKSELLQRAEKLAEDAAALVDRVGGATCEWSFDSHEHSWNGKCGVSWQFFEDGPEENRMRFCPGCGKPALIAYQPEGE